MSVNRGYQKRPDGGYSVLFGSSAATTDDIGQGLTLVHFSAQLKHYPWDRGSRGALRGCLGNV